MAFKSRKLVPQIHVFVATPAYDGKVNSEYALSLAQSMQAAAVYGVRATAGIMANGAFIDLARNDFVRRFLATDCTHLFFIDSDLEFEARAFLGLLKAGLPVCAGAYRRRQEPEDYPVRLVDHPDGGLWVEDGFVVANRVATGFLCIERSVIETMAAEAPIIRVTEQQEPIPRLFYTYITDKNSKGENGFMGEDYAWCDDYCKRFDSHIYVWPDFDFKHGGFKCNYDKWLTQEIEKNKVKE